MSECKHGVEDELDFCEECDEDLEERLKAELEAKEKDSKLTEETN